jgi:hypothetical protein
MATHRLNQRHAGTGTASHPWPLLFIAAPAAVAIWSGWVGLGELCGFGPVNLLPGFGPGFHLDTAITLPVGIESYGAYALFAWLGLKGASDRTRDFARKSAIGALILGCLGQVAYHLLAAAHWTEAPWLVVIGVACLPVMTLYFAATLTHLILADRRDAEEAKAAAELAAEEAERAKAERAAARAELAAQRQARNRGTGTAAPKRNRGGTGTRKHAPAAPEPAREPEPEPVAEEVVDIDAEARILKAMAAGELDTEAAILQLVAAGRTPSRAGRLAGRSDSYGRQVARTAKKLAEAAPEGQDAGQAN